MPSNQTFSETTSAADKSIGFDYQYYFFLYRLLNIKSGESVGLEVLDDVHVATAATFQILFQLKHTISTAAGGKPVNLASLDDDLWKTMSNWARVICDPNDGRTFEKTQLEFVRRTEFHLVTNKSKSSANLFLTKIAEFENGQCDFASVKAVVQSLHDQTANIVIKAHIADLLKLQDIVCERFFQKLRFELELDEIIKRIKISIRDKFIPVDEVDTVFDRLDSNIRADNFINVKAGNKILISYEDFMSRYQKIFVAQRKKELRYENYKPGLPDDLISQRFVKQLMHIGDVQSVELETIAEYTISKLRLTRHLLEWRRKGHVLTDEVDEFHADVQKQWKNNFHHKFRPHRMPLDIHGAALDLLHVLREKKFSIAGQELGTEFSNGELYHLSDSDVIGWHPGWESV